METSLNTLKHLYAQEQGYPNWNELKYWRDISEVADGYMNEICIRAQKAALENIKKNVSEFIESDLTVDDIFIDDYVNIISKITTPENLIK